MTVEEMAKRTSLHPADINRLLRILGTRANGGAVFLLVLVFDVLLQLGFAKDQLIALLCEFEGPLLDLGDKYSAAKPGDVLDSAMLQVLDNRFVTLYYEPQPDPLPPIYDLIEAERVTRIPIPCLSLAVVLPQLYLRAASAPGLPACSPTAEAEPKSPT